MKSKRVKDRESTVFFLFSYSFCFLPTSWEYAITHSKLLLWAVFFQPSKFFDSFLQWQVNVNSPSPSGCTTRLKGFFVTDLQQRSFYIHRCIFYISKLIDILKVSIKQQTGKKTYWRLRCYGILLAQGTGLGHTLCQNCSCRTCLRLQLYLVIYSIFFNAQYQIIYQNAKLY